LEKVFLNHSADVNMAVHFSIGIFFSAQSTFKGFIANAVNAFFLHLVEVTF